MAASKSQKPEAAFAIRLKRDGTLEGIAGSGRHSVDALPARLSGERAARDHRMPAVQAAGGLFRGMEIFRAGVQGKNLTARSPHWRSHMSKIEAMTDKNGLPAMSFRPSRRQIISGMASTGPVDGRPLGSAFAPEARRRFPRASSRRCRSRSRISSRARPAMTKSASACRRSSPTISSAADCSRRSIRPPSSNASPISTPRRNSRAGRPINAQALVTGRMTRQGDGRLKAEFRLWDVNTQPAARRPAIFHLAGILAADRAHHLRPDL